MARLETWLREAITGWATAVYPWGIVTLSALMSIW